MYPHDAPRVVLFGIPGIALVLSVLFVVAIRRASVRAGDEGPRANRATWLAAAGIAMWTAAFGAAAGSGLLARIDLRPPPLAVMMPLVLAGALTFAFSRAGTLLARHTPLAALVGIHGFRLPLELVMHEAANAGVMPVQLSFSGYNFDIVTGVSAIVLCGLIVAGRASRRLVAAWNVMGIGFLVVIVFIAVATAPFVRAFGDASINTWVCYVPFVWLPALPVAMAVAGHVLVFRHLAGEARTRHLDRVNEQARSTFDGPLR